MNARIKQLWDLSRNPSGRGHDEEKFAELIVLECCEVLKQTEDALDRQKWPTPRGCVEYIKDHFGVEE